MDTNKDKDVILNVKKKIRTLEWRLYYSEHMELFRLEARRIYPDGTASFGRNIPLDSPVGKSLQEVVESLVAKFEWEK